MARIPTHDAIVIVPGIMGSQLYDMQHDRQLWGFSMSAATALLDGGLSLTEAEREGDYSRVKATGLLRLPSWVPILRGLDVYTPLTRALVPIVERGALLEHAYDWRLPVAHNAAELHRAALDHLHDWRKRHPHARLVIIAHSMGGLLARAAGFDPGDVRACVTLGTPFGGSIKAICMLSPGGGLRGRLGDISRTLPGVYDLLPWTRTVVDEGNGARRLDVADIVALQGEKELAEAAQRFQRSLAGTPLPGHRQLVGYSQPTPQSIRLRDGIAEPLGHRCTVAGDSVLRADEGGDGTVARFLATLDTVSSGYLAQQHSSMPGADDALRQIHGIVTEFVDAGEPLGDGKLGIDLPDDPVAVGTEVCIPVTGISHPRHGRCEVSDASTGAQISRPDLEWRDGAIVAAVVTPAPGLYRVQLRAVGGSPLSQFIFAQEA